ncbi:MAG: glutathione peroxidase [Bradymonadia bacterium]
MRPTHLMLALTGALAFWATPICAEPAAEKPAAQTAPIHALTVTDIQGKPVSLKDYAGKAMLIVNTASQCGFTPQYAGLERLHRTYKDKGLVVLAFPSNDFGGQEPGDAKMIQGFVADNFSITFPLFDKVHAKGPEKAPLYTLLTEKSSKTQGEVRWNFTKFLVSPKGEVVARFESSVDPMDPALVKAVEGQLAK